MTRRLDIGAAVGIMGVMNERERIEQEQSSRQRVALERALKRAGGSVSKAAAALGYTRAWAHRLVRRYGLQALVARARKKAGAEHFARPSNARE